MDRQPRRNRDKGKERDINSAATLDRTTGPSAKHRKSRSPIANRRDAMALSFALTDDDTLPSHPSQSQTQPTPSNSHIIHKKKKHHPPSSYSNANAIAGPSSGPRALGMQPSTGFLGFGADDSTMSTPTPAAPPRLRHKKPLPDFSLNPSNGAGPSTPIGSRGSHLRKKDKASRSFAQAKNGANTNGGGNDGTADPDWFTMNEEEEKGAGTGTGTESIYDGMTSSSGVAGVNSELKKLKKEMESLRKQAASNARAANEQSKIIQELRRELSVAAKTNKDQTALIEKLKAESRQADETISNVEGALQCQICIDTLSKPYSLSPCGHILCLHCLQDWFRAAPIDPSDQMEIDSETDEPLPLTQRRKTCPCCRARVKERPVRSFVVRGLVEVIKKAKSAKETQAAVASARAAASAGVGEGANVVRDSSPPPEMEGEDPWEGIFEEPYSSEEESGDDDDDDEDEDEDGSDIEEDENDMEMVTSEDDERAMGTGMAEDDDEEDDDDDDGAEMTDGANMDESGTGRRVTVFEWFASRAGRGRGNLNGNANEDANANADQGESDEEDGASVYVSGSEGGAAVVSDEHEHTGSEMDDGEGQNQEDDDSDDDSSTYSNSSDEDYPGPWISPSWEPPLHHPSSTLITSQLPHSHPHPHSPHLTQQIQLLSRGVTNEMLRLYPGRWRYTHEEGIVMREFGVEIWLGWNLRLRENEGEGVDEEGSGAERFFRRIWEEMYEGRPERWRREPIPNPPTPPLNTNSLGR